MTQTNNESISESIKQWINESYKESKPTNQLTVQWFKHAMNEWMNQLMKQWINQSQMQWMHQ